MTYICFLYIYIYSSSHSLWTSIICVSNTCGMCMATSRTSWIRMDVRPSKWPPRQGACCYSILGFSPKILAAGTRVINITCGPHSSPFFLLVFLLLLIFLLGLLLALYSRHCHCHHHPSSSPSSLSPSWAVWHEI